MSAFELTAKPRLRPGLELTKLGLSQDEGILASRIDGKTTVQELGYLVTKSIDWIQQALSRLDRAGVVVWTDVVADGPRPELLDDERPDYGNFIFPPALMMEPGDLSETHRKRIIWFHFHLEHWNYYELLKVPRSADNQALKKAYRLRSKEWHSDQWRFASDLGSFSAMLDQIFDRIRTAHVTLSDTIRRSAYDAENLDPIDEDDIAKVLQQQNREERERRRERLAEEKRKKNNPMRIRIQRAKGLLDDSKSAREAGDILKARSLAQMAEAYDPRPEHKELVEQLDKEAADIRVQPLLRSARRAEVNTRWEEAIELCERAVSIAPEHGPARIRLAYNLVKSARPGEAAVPHGQKGVQFLPEDPEAHFVLGLCYDKSGKGRAAIRSLEKAVELKDNYKEAKKRLRELKWGF